MYGKLKFNWKTSTHLVYFYSNKWPGTPRGSPKRAQGVTATPRNPRRQRQSLGETWAINYPSTVTSFYFNKLQNKTKSTVTKPTRHLDAKPRKCVVKKKTMKWVPSGSITEAIESHRNKEAEWDFKNGAFSLYPTGPPEGRLRQADPPLHTAADGQARLPRQESALSRLARHDRRWPGTRLRERRQQLVSFRAFACSSMSILLRFFFKFWNRCETKKKDIFLHSMDVFSNEFLLDFILSRYWVSSNIEGINWILLNVTN